jgi:hypothetical protein
MMPVTNIVAISSSGNPNIDTQAAAKSAVDEWAEIIRPHFLQGNASLIAGALKLIKAKKDLKKTHGSFIELVTIKLGLDLDTAERWMTIARNPVLSNSAHARNLPLSWMTLFTLAKLPPKVLEGSIEDGTVTPETSRKDAERLVKRACTPHTVIERLSAEADVVDAVCAPQPQPSAAKSQKAAATDNVGQDVCGPDSRGEIERRLARLEELEHKTRRQEIQIGGYESEVGELKSKLTPETNIDPQRRLFRQAMRALAKAETAGTLEKERRALTQHATTVLVEVVRSAVRDGLRVDRLDLAYRPEVH